MTNEFTLKFYEPVIVLSFFSNYFYRNVDLKNIELVCSSIVGLQHDLIKPDCKPASEKYARFPTKCCESEHLKIKQIQW